MVIHDFYHILDICTKMKLDSLSGHSETEVSATDGDEKEEANQKEEDKKGGGRETLFHLRRRSRKRRSFMETGYTSMVSYPVPDVESKLLHSRAHKKCLAPGSDEASVQSSTVSSLKHSEGEPAQLESKPILSKPHSHALSGYESNELVKDPQTSSRNRNQEMEMEPDSMEFKSVTALVKSVPMTITVVRCRVDPDGKESADCQGDWKEDGIGREVVSKVEEEEKTHMPGSESFTRHQADNREETEGMRAYDCKRLLTAAERQLGANILRTCLVNLNKKGSNNNVLPIQSVVQEENHEQDRSNPLLYLPPPPPPPPSSPHHLIPTQLSHSQQEGGESSSTEQASSCDNRQLTKPNSFTKAQLHLEIPASVNDEGAAGVSSTVTTSDEVTDSTNSDNVFEDDEMSSTLNSSSGDKKADWTLTRANSDTMDSLTPPVEHKGDSSMTITSEDHSSIRSINCDYSHTINSITAKLGVAASVTSPIFNSSARHKGDPVTSYGLTQPVQGLAKRPSSPTHFLFQPCSPSFMGRLSAATLRGKIQNLPLYLSRSQETLNKAGAVDTGKSDTEITIRVTDVHDITQTIDLEMETTAESVDSDDSDTTVTGSEVDGEPSAESTTVKSFHSGSEVRDVGALMPVQTEPKPQQPHQHLHTGPFTDTPGPITEPPASIVNSLQRDTSGLKADIPGPAPDTGSLSMPGYKTSNQPCSVSPPIVVTTQNLNGHFHNQSQKIAEQFSDSSSGCKVFTMCEDPAAEAETAPTLKSDYSCGSLLASGCESVVEGVQVPLDACGCPVVYSNCFSGGVSFDDELTLYEFSCRTQSSGVTQPSGLSSMTSSPIPSFLSMPTTDSPSFPHSMLHSSSTSELSPLLSPLSDSSDSLLCQGQRKDKGNIRRLGQQHYPEPPAGFQVLRADVDQLLSILEGSGGHGGCHPRDMCPAHFTENRRVLQIEARRLMAGCQKVVGIGQSPDDMLHALADSFRTLVELAGTCLWFSGCDRCIRRNAEAVAGLADVARSFRDFCLAAERASSKRSCQDLSTKLLAKQCTALTASVFCLMQLFRTLTSL